jgi:hypothetical protein
MPNYRKSRCLLLEGYSNALHARIETSVRDNPYTSSVASGFRVLSRRANYFIAEYIERQIREERVIDPFGEVTAFERTIFISTAVLVRLQAPQIIMLDPPTTSLKVVHMLCGFVDFHVPVLTPDLDLRAWAKSLGSSKFRMQCHDVRIQDIDWGNGFSGNLTVTGEKDVFGKAESLVSGRQHNLSTVAGLAEIDGKQARIRLLGTGRVELAIGIEPESHCAIYELARW